jgi:hypothetical protein
MSLKGTARSLLSSSFGIAALVQHQSHFETAESLPGPIDSATCYSLTEPYRRFLFHMPCHSLDPDGLGVLNTYQLSYVSMIKIIIRSESTIAAHVPGRGAQPGKGFWVAIRFAQATESMYVSEWNMVCPDQWKLLLQLSRLPWSV